MLYIVCFYIDVKNILCTDFFQIGGIKESMRTNLLECPRAETLNQSPEAFKTSPLAARAALRVHA